MTDDLVKDAREALAGVTEGPWHVTECGDYWVEHKQPLANADGLYGVALCGDMMWPSADILQCEWKANARFIAAARSLVPKMADRIKELEAEVARLQEIVAHYMRMFPTGEAALDAIAEIEEATDADV